MQHHRPSDATGRALCVSGILLVCPAYLWFLRSPGSYWPFLMAGVGLGLSVRALFVRAANEKAADREAVELFRDGKWHCSESNAPITPGHEQARSVDPAAPPVCPSCCKGPSDLEIRATCRTLGLRPGPMV